MVGIAFCLFSHWGNLNFLSVNLMEKIKKENPPVVLVTQRWHGIDKHTLAMLLHRLWTVIAGGGTVLLIPLCLSSIQQGYYFTFASILALQIFFELGIGQVVIQIVAHEAAHLRKDSDGLYVGDKENVARLLALQTQLRRWYVPAALLFGCIISVVGLLFFWDAGLEFMEWAPAWTLLVSTTAINFYLSWKLSIVEGFGLVKNISLLRLKQSIIGYLVLWAGLIFGGGLWAVISVPLTSVVVTLLWLRSDHIVNIFRLKSDLPPLKPISWRNDIFPFQWRIAVSWVSGYFIFQLFTPLAFKKIGVEEAGRLGLAITVFSAISTIGLSWVNAKAPSLSMMIARKESRELIQLLKGVMVRSLLFTIALCLFLILIVWTLGQFDVKIISRIASLPVLFCLASVTIVNSIIFSAATFMRAHREEPMLGVSVISGALVAATAWFGSNYGPLEIIIGYASVTIFISLPWTLFIFSRYLNRYKF
ncbi:hypothetical protein [Comamonas thiooxydans]|uniref:hypothetical protein n=1 Tax=Comamonas thiooxydans TaxID=363952 RepID=UPI00128EBDFE|nr:hypothetical protein [Comamonas thiooxydans]